MLDLYLKLMTWVKREAGQDLVEYALLLALLALVCVVAIALAGTQISTFWAAIATSLSLA